MRIVSALFVPLVVPGDVLRQLSFATSGGPVCPQLQHLVWAELHGWEHSQQFLSSHLVSVFFWPCKVNIHASLALASAISSIPTTRLEKLGLLGSTASTPPVRSALSGVVQRLNTCFKKIYIRTSLSDAAWGHLASLPKLESLRVTDTPSIEVSKSIPHELTFPTLKHVTLELSDQCQHLPVLFSLLKSSPLKEVVVEESSKVQHHVGIPTEVAFAILKAELQRHINTLIFTEFYPADLTFVSHLGLFSSIKTLECRTRCLFSGECASPLTDSDIERLASGLPQLVTLTLGHICKYSPYNLTIKSMISLSTHCLSLDSLRLSCDLTNISEDVKVESGEPDPRLKAQSFCALVSLDFRWLIKPKDPGALEIMESALHRLFPRLGLT